MTLRRSAADVLAEHVTLECECIDRVYANVYVPRLQYAAGVAYFFRGHRGATFAFTVLADPISKGFVAAIHRFAEGRGVPVIRFAKGQRIDDVPTRNCTVWPSGPTPTSK